MLDVETFENVYEIDCSVCETLVEVEVKTGYQEPAYCPMCGSSVSVE